MRVNTWELAALPSVSFIRQYKKQKRKRHGLSSFLSFPNIPTTGYLGDVGSVPDNHNKVSLAIKWIIIILLVGGSCLQIVKNTSMKPNKWKCNKTRCACALFCNIRVNSCHSHLLGDAKFYWTPYRWRQLWRLPDPTGWKDAGRQPCPGWKAHRHLRSS